MRIKICGMREAGNLLAITDLNPDFLGFIFYEKSTRCMREVLAAEVVRSLPPSICKVGVFVDADLTDVLAANVMYGLDFVQLHGHESAAYCQQAQTAGLRLIKAFAVDSHFDFGQLAAYEPFCEHFLFDTKGELPGGNGTAFDWSVLAGYSGGVSFFLSGGLGPNNLTAMQRFHHPQFYGFDLNSQIETAPGLKNVDATYHLLAGLRQPTAS